MPLAGNADIPWAEAEKLLAAENARLARMPGGHNGTYFVICTIYFTPAESGFTVERGFDVTPETRPGLGGRRYPRDFLLSVRKEGYGRLAVPVRGYHYIRYEGRGRYGFGNAPTGIARAPIVPRLSGAVRSSQMSLYRPSILKLTDQTVLGVFGSDTWKVSDTGGGLRRWQIDLYWGEDEPMGAGRWSARPRGTEFEYAYSYVNLTR